MPRILQKDLQLPALYLISLQNGQITTSQLSEQLRDLLNPRGEDLEILDGRPDDKFSQIVRNLTGTTRTFVQNGFIDREAGTNDPLSIGEKGRELLLENKAVLNYLFANDFNFEDLIKSFQDIQHSNNTEKDIEFFDIENVMINEGQQVTVETKVYKRSKKLRDRAIRHYTVDQRIKCQACCFDFEDFYGDYGKDFIEVHHEKPVFQYVGDDVEKTIEDALDNVKPVCSNCHRMIHRRRNNLLTLDKLKQHINQNLDFCEDDAD